MTCPRVLLYGSGKIGRGFLGQLFTEAGCQVVFCDIIPELVQALNAHGSYHLALVSNLGREERIIAGVRAVDGQDLDAVADEIVAADLVATAVGARSLTDIAPILAEGVRRRREQGYEHPLNIIVCENLVDAPRILGEMMAEHLGTSDLGYLREHVGLVDAVIDRMVPEVAPDLLANDPSFILTEPYGLLQVNAQGFVGPLPTLHGLDLVDDVRACVDCKLYLHNGGHAMLAYLGSLRGLTYGYEALGDALVRAELGGAWVEMELALVDEYGFDLVGLRDYMRKLEERWANRALSDTILRLGRDPIRKLGPTDRLVGPATLSLRHGRYPETLVGGIAAGLAFGAPRDARAVELQGMIARLGPAEALRSISGVDPDGELGRGVLAAYGRIRRDGWPR
jgi:mannitol-1-phosphate 5-dehydrogenase